MGYHPLLDECLKGAQRVIKTQGDIKFEGMLYRQHSSLANAFEIRHAKSEDGWLCYIVEPIKLDAVSLADATEGWNRRFDNE